ncbi:MAG: hypothetical protein ACLR2G_06590 [Phascolarctobacterium faecium]
MPAVRYDRIGVSAVFQKSADDLTVQFKVNGPFQLDRRSTNAFQLDWVYRIKASAVGGYRSLGRLVVGQRDRPGRPGCRR